MAITLQSALRPGGVDPLESQAYTPEELAGMAQVAHTERLDAMTPLERGFARGMYNTPALYGDALGQIVEPLSESVAKPIFDWSQAKRAEAEQYRSQSDISSVDNVNSLGDAGNYIAGMIGENMPQLPAVMAGGAVTRLGLRGAAMPNLVKSGIGATVAGAPMNMGEMVGGLREDPTIMANTTPAQRLATSAAYALPAAALDAIPEALLMERALGAGKAVKNVFKNGVKAGIKDGIKHVAKAVPEAALTEGLPEAAQQRTQQAILNQLNPERDTTNDWRDIKESFFGGWAAGSPHSGVGRSMDVAWAQGRGAVDAARDLLSRKKLPENLKTGSDEDIVGWDKQDDEQRNGWAARLSEAITGDPDAPQHLREKASEFMEKASAGASKAWESLRDGLDIEERYNNGRAGVERFLGAAKRTYKDLGGMKENAEATPEDEIMYKAFGEHLDPKSSVARDTELKSNLFNTVKQSLLDDSWSELPWHELEDEFGTIGRATAAVTQLRDGLVREGKLDYDDAFGKLLEASANEGQLGERAKMDVVKRYARLQFGDIDDSTARQIVRRMGDGLASYSSWDQKKRASFDNDLKKAFGDNSEKVLQALAPKQPKAEESENLEDVDLEKGVTPSLQETTPDRRFVGQAVDKARRNDAEGKTATVRDHGGMWNLGHGSAETRAAIRTNYIQTRRSLQQQGAAVKTLRPLEYAEAAGISAKKIAENLGVFVKTEEDARTALKDHPARMLMVEKRGEVGLRNDNEQITKDDIATLGETTQKKQRVAEGKHVDDATAQAVKQALGSKDYATRRKALKALGFPNAVRVEQTSRGQKVVNNLNHGNAGRFEVHMNDGAVHTLSAQELIAFQQTRGRKDADGGSQLTHFTAALAQIMTNPDVKEIKVRKISGGEVKIDSAKYKAKTKDGQHVDRAAKLHADLTKQFGEYFELAPGLTLGKAVKKSGAWAGALNRKTELDEAVDKQEQLEARLDEIGSELMDVDIADDEMDALESEASDIREQLIEMEGEIARLSELQDMYEGEGEKQATAGEDTRPQSDKDANASGLDNTAYTTGDFNDDGTPKHPAKDVGRAVGDERKNTKVRGVDVMRLKTGVGAEDLTKPMQHALLKIRQALGIVKGRIATLDVARDYIARAAAAQHDGNKKARDAFILMAQHHIYSALRDEATVLGYESGGEMTPEVQRLIDAAAQFKGFEDKFQASKGATLKAAEGYGAFVEPTPRTTKEKKAFQADPDRWTHHQRFLNTLESKTDEEIKADGIARKARIESLESWPNMSDNMRQLLKLMREENDLARDVLRRRMGGETKAEAPKAEAPKAEAPKAEAPKADPAREERAKSAEKVEKEINEKLDEIESNTKKLTKNVGDLIDGVRDAFNALKNAFIDGELNRDDLIAALRKSIAALREAVGNVVDGIVKHTQGFIKGYRETKKAMEEMAEKSRVRAQNKFAGVFAISDGTDGPTKSNSEGSFASGKGVTPEELAQVKEYVNKVLGPKAHVALSEILGEASATWNRGTDGEAYIRIAVNAANPMSKAHHEAMHEFFQRLLDSQTPAAETLRRASSTASVLNQIRKFFKDDPNYAKINEALNDPHERVAYMYQLWAAGAINLGPNTQGVFAKISAAFRKIFGLITSGQHAQAIMEQFHDGKLSTESDVARVLGQNQQAKQGYLAAAEKWLAPLAASARELIITAQNELIDSENKSLEKIGRMFSNETGAHDKDISLMSARVMKTNQMADRFGGIIRGLDDKQVDALRTAMQTGKTATDPDVAKAQARMRKMFDDVHAYLKDAGVDLPKLDNYFPRAWDHTAISANRDEFVKLLAKEANMTEANAQLVADTLIKNRGAEPLTEGEYRVGYTPFMAAANKRVLNFTPSEAMTKFQNKDMAGTVMTYIQHAVHKAEYARRFGAHGEKLRQLMQEAVGEEVGDKAWNAAKAQADADFKRVQDDLKQRFTNDFEKIADGLYKAGYKNGEVDIEHVAKHLSGDPAKAFKQFDAQLRRAQRAIMAMEGTLGYNVSNLVRKLNSGIIVYENMRLLSMSLFSQVIDPLGVAVRGGTLKDAWSTFKLGLQGTVAGWRGKPVESSAMTLAMKLGIIDASNFLNSQGQAYSGLYMGETAKKFNDRLFRWNGVEGFSQGTRVGAMLAAIEFIKFHSGKGNEHSVRYLAELGLTKDDVKLVDGDLDYTDRAVQHAIFRWVDSAILRPNAAMRPSWASDPHWALLFHMKQFVYAAHKVFLERIYNEAKHGNMSPALTMVLTYVPAMIAADFLRGLLANGGKEPPWKRGWGFGEYLMEGVERAGLLGIPQIALDTAKYGPSELAGPFGSQVAKAAKTYNYASSKDRALDFRAASTGLEEDKKRAEDFDGTTHAVKRTMRDALPMGSITKKLVYDPLEHAITDN